MKHFLKICVVLTLVCTLMATALALINGVTAPLIRKNETEKRAEILEAFFPEMEGEYEVFDSAVDGVACIYAVRGVENTLLGYCAEVTKVGYAGNVNMMVALTQEQKILGVSLVSHSETKGLSDGKLANALCESFEGKEGQQKLTSRGGEIDGIAGATYSSRAVLEGVNAAVEAVELLKEGAKSSS